MYLVELIPTLPINYIAIIMKKNTINIKLNVEMLKHN